MIDDDIVFGIHAVRALIEADPERIDTLWLADERRDRRLNEIRAAAQEAGVRFRAAPGEKLDKLANGGRHQGAVARCRHQALRDERDLARYLDRLDAEPLLLVLDGVQDPHNLGACLRTADGAGVHGVVVPRDRCVSVTAVVRRVAVGASESVPLFTVQNLARVLDQLRRRGMWLIGLTDVAEADIYSVDLTGPIALVLGGEGAGLRRLTLEKCDVVARLPMAGTVSSLNVSVATGVALYEAVRQRRL